MYKVFATEWSKPQNANTMMGNITPTVVDKPLRGAYFTEPIERVIRNPQRIAEHNALIAHKSVKILPSINAAPLGTTASAKGEYFTSTAVKITPSMLPKKQTGNFQKFFTPISGMSEIKPVNSFISNITIAKIPREKRHAPMSFPALPNRLLASKDAVPPIPIVRPEQNAIKQKEINCAFVNFSIGFIRIPPKKCFYANAYDYTATHGKNQAEMQRNCIFLRKKFTIMRMRTCARIKKCIKS